VGGGALALPVTVLCSPGRSPRGRRSLLDALGAGRVLGSISAWAEEPACRSVFCDGGGVDLRVGGGALATLHAMSQKRGRSPRGRRSPTRSFGRAETRGSISAWAEEPFGRSDNQAVAGVDLRVGGGACVSCLHRLLPQGRSPRGRRSRGQPPRLYADHGSISAWAEEQPGDWITVSSDRVDLRVGGGAAAISIDVYLV